MSLTKNFCNDRNLKSVKQYIRYLSSVKSSKHAIIDITAYKSN